MRVRTRLSLEDYVESSEFEDYGVDILSHMFSMEMKTLPANNFLIIQKEITIDMRQLLIISLSEVQDLLELRPETFQLTVNIVDRYCEHTQVPRAEYYILGLTALWIASKYEETHGRVPTLKTLTKISGGKYSENVFLKYESKILVALAFDIGHPSMEAFFKVLLKSNSNSLNIHSEVRNIARYFMELSISAYNGLFIGMKASTIAHASLLLAQQLYEENCILTIYKTLADSMILRELNVLMQLLLDAAELAPPRIFKKYEQSRYDNASLRVRKYLASELEISDTSPNDLKISLIGHKNSLLLAQKRILNNDGTHKLAVYLTNDFDIRKLIDERGHDIVLDMCYKSSDSNNSCSKIKSNLPCIDSAVDITIQIASTQNSMEKEYLGHEENLNNEHNEHIVAANNTSNIGEHNGKVNNNNNNNNNNKAITTTPRAYSKIQHTRMKRKSITHDREELNEVNKDDFELISTPSTKRIDKNKISENESITPLTKNKTYKSMQSTSYLKLSNPSDNNVDNNISKLLTPTSKNDFKLNQTKDNEMMDDISITPSRYKSVHIVRKNKHTADDNIDIDNSLDKNRNQSINYSKIEILPLDKNRDTATSSKKSSRHIRKYSSTENLENDNLISMTPTQESKINVISNAGNMPKKAILFNTDIKSNPFVFEKELNKNRVNNNNSDLNKVYTSQLLEQKTPLSGKTPRMLRNNNNKQSKILNIGSSSIPQTPISQSKSFNDNDEVKMENDDSIIKHQVKKEFDNGFAILTAKKLEKLDSRFKEKDNIVKLEESIVNKLVPSKRIKDESNDDDINHNDSDNKKVLQKSKSNSSIIQKPAVTTGSMVLSRFAKKLNQVIAANDILIYAEIKDLYKSFPNLDSKYLLVSKIGEGTFSSVYKAVDLSYDRFDNNNWVNFKKYAKDHPDPLSWVALKRIYATSGVQRIYNEIKTLFTLSGHPNIVPIITAHRYEDQVIAVLPYFQHLDFRLYFLDMTIYQIQGYAKSLLSALEHAHKHNIIHRDVKPSNYLFDLDSNDGVLVDFGLAQKYNSHHSNNNDNNTGNDVDNEVTDRIIGGYIVKDARPNFRANRAGTRGFRAPEVLFRLQNQTPSIDIWSVGVILLAIVSGFFPFFKSEDDQEALLEIAHLFGKQEMQQIAKKFYRRFETNIPSIPNTRKYKFKELINQMNPARAKRFNEAEEIYDLLECILTLDPQKRITAKDALNHPFFTI